MEKENFKVLKFTSDFWVLTVKIIKIVLKKYFYYLWIKIKGKIKKRYLKV
jgi:hypothetical protein